MPLSTNWRESLGVFISQRDGSNSTGTGSKALPFRTPRNSPSSQKIRAGYYLLDSPLSGYGDLIGDGFVFFDGSGFPSNIEDSNGINFLFKNITFNNIKYLNVFNPTASGDGRIEECVLASCTFQGRLENFNFNFVSGGFIRLTSQTIQKEAFRCTLVNNARLDFSARPASGNLENSFVQSGSRVDAATVQSFTNCTFEIGSNINGTLLENITLDGDLDTITNTYAANVKFSGTVTIDGDDITFANCFWTDDPKFNDPANGDYTLKNDSPLVNNLDIIGRYTVATRFDASHPAFDPLNSGVSYTNVTRNLVDDTFDLNGGFVEGEVVSTDNPTQCIELPFATTLTEAVIFFGTFLYNQGEWIDDENYNVGVNNEVRLTLDFQFYDENEPNGSNSPLNFSPWISFENQMPLEVDGSGRGNGNVDADLTDLDAVTAKRFRVRFKQRTNGV